VVLQIYRDFLKPGSEAAFKAVEEDAARMCAELSCPHPHLAIESVTGPKEVWWLNAFESEAEKERVYREYASNQPLMTALADIGPRKKDLTETPLDVLASYRPDLSGGDPWPIAGARFFVVTVTTGDAQPEGSVFESPDGTRFVFRPVTTREHADRISASAGLETRVFAVRPYWGMPAKEWIAADPEFWSVNPCAVRGTGGR
jgi:hypothetical protein